jgi:hypothetical protein
VLVKEWPYIILVGAVGDTKNPRVLLKTKITFLVNVGSRRITCLAFSEYRGFSSNDLREALTSF